MRKVRWVLTSLSPKYWLQLSKFSPAWDKHLNMLLDAKAPFKYVTQYNAEIGGVEMWIANHPYNSFVISVPGCKQVRPRRATIARAYEALKQQRPNCEELIFNYLAKMEATHDR